MTEMIQMKTNLNVIEVSHGIVVLKSLSLASTLKPTY